MQRDNKQFRSCYLLGEELGMTGFPINTDVEVITTESGFQGIRIPIKEYTYAVFNGHKKKFVVVPTVADVNPHCSWHWITSTEDEYLVMSTMCGTFQQQMDADVTWVDFRVRSELVYWEYMS